MGLWDQLREMLDYVSGREKLVYATNYNVLRLRDRGVIEAAVSER
jgi:hypothetical protein